jgi:hypothetical protein
MLRTPLLLAALLAPAFAAEEPVHVATLVAGVDGVVAEPATELVADPGALVVAVHRIRGAAAEIPPVDFAREVVLVVNAGPNYLKDPPSCAGTLDRTDGLSVLIHVPTAQIGPGTPLASPDIYLFLRLPRQFDRPYAVCFDRRHYIAEAPVWTETDRFVVGVDGKVTRVGR